MQRYVAAAVFAIGLAGPAFAEPAAPASQQDLRQAADMLGKEYDEAYNSKSASAVASLYTPNGILVPPGRPPIEGRQALTVYYQGRFDSGAGGHLTKINQAYAFGEGGFALGQFSVTAPGSDGAPREVHGNTAYILERVPEGWKFRLIIASPAPAR